MKKLYILMIAVILITFCSCKARPENPSSLPESEIEGYELVRPIVCGDFPTKLEEIEKRSDFIIIATPLELFKDSETVETASLGNTIRKLRVDKVLKGEEITELTLYEPLYISDGKAVSVNYNSTPMIKDFQYLIFCYESNTEGIYCTHNVFAIKTEINNKFPVHNQSTYGQVLKKYKEYFDGFDYRITDDTDKVFYTENVNKTPDFSNYVEYKGKIYKSLTDLYYGFDHYFEKIPELYFTGDTAKVKVRDYNGAGTSISLKDTDSEVRVYRTAEGLYNDSVLFILADGLLIPMCRYYDDGNIDTLKELDIKEIRIYGQYYEDFCYAVPTEEIEKVLSVFQKQYPNDTSDNMFDDRHYIFEFCDKDGFYHRTILYYDKAQMFFKNIGTDARDFLLGYLKEEYRKPNLHNASAYPIKPA